MKRKPLPKGADPGLPARELADRYHVSLSTVYKWKHERGSPLRQYRTGGSRPSDNGMWQSVGEEDWARGCAHVGKLLGVSRQAASYARRAILRGEPPTGRHPARKRRREPCPPGTGRRAERSGNHHRARPIPCRSGRKA